MRRHRVAWTASAVLVVFVALAALLATRHAAPGATEIHSPLLGHRAPAVAGTTLGGAPLSVADLRGDVVVLNFWASWCGPCQKEAPDLSTFAWAHRDDHVRVVGVVWEDEISAARAFQTRYGSLYPSIVDPGGQIANAYGVTGPPTTFFIGPNGVVDASLVGATTTAQLDRVLARVRS